MRLIVFRGALLMLTVVSLLVAGCIPKQAGYDEMGHRKKPARAAPRPAAQGGQAPTSATAPTGQGGTQPSGEVSEATIESMMEPPKTEVVKESGDCAKRMQELFKALAEALPEAAQKAQNAGELERVALEIVRQKHGEKLLKCPITGEPYLIGEEKLRDQKVYGAVGDAKAHPDGTRLVLMPKRGENKLVVATWADAKKAFSEREKERAFRTPPESTPEGRCLLIVADITRALLQYAQKENKFPQGKTSLDVKPVLQRYYRHLQPEEYWVCPITGEPYQINQKLLGMTLTEVQEAMLEQRQGKGKPYAFVYDAKPHPDGTRCISTLFGATRIRADEWDNYQH
jgi:hypothetical protein